MKTTRGKEKAGLAEKDSKVMEEMAECLRAYVWEVSACGRDGKVELGKIKQLTPQVLKILVNYL